MKKILVTSGFVLYALFSTAQNSGPEILAEKIAQRMKDTLSLTEAQKDQLYVINMQLHNEKLVARQTISNRDSLSAELQRVENKRDVLYQPILNTKFELYLQKKRNLVNNN